MKRDIFERLRKGLKKIVLYDTNTGLFLREHLDWTADFQEAFSFPDSDTAHIYRKKYFLDGHEVVQRSL